MRMPYLTTERGHCIISQISKIKLSKKPQKWGKTEKHIKLDVGLS
jgi:hypothetical protein